MPDSSGTCLPIGELSKILQGATIHILVSILLH